MIDRIYSEMKEKMEKSIALLSQELSKLRTGRASPALVESIRVDYYGSTLPLNQVATISIPEARLIIIQPWDKNALEAVEKAIYKSAIGLTPNNDGNVIRLSIPPLTTERRDELVRLAQKLGEDTKVAVRNVRREANNEIKKQEKDKQISEDNAHKAHDRIQKLTDDSIVKVDEHVRQKEKEIRET